MHIDQLIYFLNVAETGSINAAAQKSFLTQQAINMSLKKLETELDTTLLERNYQGISLTPQGHIFASYAKEILHTYEQMRYELKRFDANDLNLFGSLSLFSSSVLTELFFPRIIHDFMVIYPHTSVKIIDVQNDVLLSYLLQGYCDVSLLSASKDYIQNELAASAAADIKAVPLVEDSLVVCARADHPLMRHKVLTNDMIAQYALEADNSYQFSLYQVLTGNMQNYIYQGYLSNSICSSGNAALHKKLILEGNAMTFMPRLAYQYKFREDGLSCAPVKEAQRIAHCLLYREDAQQANYELLQTFIHFIQIQIQRRFQITPPAWSAAEESG